MGAEEREPRGGQAPEAVMTLRHQTEESRRTCAARRATAGCGWREANARTVSTRSLRASACGHTHTADQPAIIALAVMLMSPPQFSLYHHAWLTSPAILTVAYKHTRCRRPLSLFPLPCSFSRSLCLESNFFSFEFVMLCG